MPKEIVTTSRSEKIEKLIKKANEKGSESSKKSELKRSKSSSSVSRRRKSSKDFTPIGEEGLNGASRESVEEQPSGFLAKVTCWQQRIDPNVDVNLNKKKKQRPVSIAGDSPSVSMKTVEKPKAQTRSATSSPADYGVTSHPVNPCGKHIFCPPRTRFF